MSWSDGYLSAEELEQQFPVMTNAPKRYFFERIDRVDVGNSGAPKLASGPRASFQPDPDWLKAEVWKKHLTFGVWMTSARLKAGSA